PAACEALDDEEIRLVVHAREELALLGERPPVGVAEGVEYPEDTLEGPRDAVAPRAHALADAVGFLFDFPELLGHAHVVVDVGTRVHRMRLVGLHQLVDARAARGSSPARDFERLELARERAAHLRRSPGLSADGEAADLLRR